MREKSFCFAGSVHPSELGEARLQAHYALQWLARICYGYISELPDKEHTSFIWQPNQEIFFTEKLSNGFYFGCYLPDLILFYQNAAGTYQEISCDGKTNEEIGAWVVQAISDMSLDDSHLHQTLPYHIPDHHLYDDGMYDVIDNALALRELGLWLNYSHDVLHKVLDTYNTVPTLKPHVRCWPEKFEMSVSLQPKTAKMTKASRVKIGLSLGDEYYDEPYFYVVHDPYIKQNRLRDLHFIGHWHMQGFVGAVSLSSRLWQLDNRDDLLLTFFDQAIEVG